jgi:hypothetical protein
MWLLVKTATLFMGFSFFALYPIATNFPEYRLLVSPTKQLLWNIPTHGTPSPQTHPKTPNTNMPQRNGP